MRHNSGTGKNTNGAPSGPLDGKRLNSFITFLLLNEVV
jgi:hypothetical protein